MKIQLISAQTIDLYKTFTCGQAFRWRAINEDSFEGIINKRFIRVRKIETGIEIEGDDLEEECIYRRYFDLDRDYESIYMWLSQKDDRMAAAVAFGRGIHLLRQSPWEMLITFIVSANNNIPRITRSIERMSESCGGRVGMYQGGESAFAFPSPKELSFLSLEMLREFGVGYRDKYIYASANKMMDETIDLETWDRYSTEELRKHLLDFMGVGKKVADCIMLFAYGRQHVFPVDTWINKALKRYYPQIGEGKNDVDLFVSDYFGEYAGIAQQLLFYYVREHDGR